ncbi:hypothetical protein ACHAXS_001925, partial [Conticribra weissflogii]
MLGSLDCTHTIWKNCPKAWAGSYKGKENSPSIVLEGISDYHMFFWHASYGYAGTLNDKTIFDLSPFQQFVKGIKIPLTNEETKYTKWQEAVRKDIERAFGNLKILWKFVCHPIEIWSLNDIADRITTSLILHNIVVADRVMGDDPNERYDPSKRIEDLRDFDQ